MTCVAGASPKEVPEVEVVVDRTHSMFYMLECLLDRPKRSTAMATTFRSRVGDWSPMEKALEEWKESLYSKELSALRFPDGYGRSRNLSDVLEKVSLQSDGWEDFAQRATPWLGSQAARRFSTALKTLDPLYEKYWWTGPALGGRRAELVADMQRGDFADSFAKAMEFYQGELQSSKAVVSLIPYHRGVGEKEVSTFGHNAGELQVFEVLTDRPDSSLAGVCFHEFVHGLWNGQNPEVARRWEQRFASHGLWGRLAYVQLNEGLATALGNGWFQQRVTSQLDERPWYNDRVIDSYARALFPIVVPILEAGRTPTDAELDAMAGAFRLALPQADRTFDVVAAELLTVTERPEARQRSFQDALMRLGPVRSSWVKAPGDVFPSATFVIVWRDSSAGPNSLRQTDGGWQLEFGGDSEELLQLLRQLQSSELREF